MSQNAPFSLDEVLSRVELVYLHGIALTVSAIAYAAMLIMYWNCCKAIFKPSHLYSRRKQGTLLVYTTYLMIVSTIAFAQTAHTFAAVGTFINNAATRFRPTFFPLTFALWGADGFMIWRCNVLYSSLPRGKFMMMRCFLGFLAMAIVVTGVLLAFSSLTVVIEVGIALLSTSIALNSTLTALIVGRILYHQRSIGQHFGDAHKSLYARVISLCVESCAVILIFEIPSVVTMSSGGALWFVVVEFYASLINSFPLNLSAKLALMLFNILPHIFVISALLLIYRVAESRDITQSIKTAEMQSLGLRFQTAGDPAEDQRCSTIEIVVRSEATQHVNV